jgi:hypothetical protein
VTRCNISWVSVRESLPRENRYDMVNPLATRRGFWTFTLVMWAAMMLLVGVVGVGLLVHASPGAFVFAACFLAFGVLFWCWVFRRFVR